MELGFIFHWGPYCVPAFDISSTTRKIQNGSEWYLRRLMDSKLPDPYRPISGYKETGKYHEKYYKGKTYDDFRNKFSKIKVDVFDDWCKIVKKLGGTYIILTAKHHDGFCLWPTKYTNGGCSKQNLVKDFIDAGRKHNLKVGLYYSWMEFENKITINYLDTIVKPQIDELRKYKPDIWWFDGSWDCKTKYSIKFMTDVCTKLKKKNVLINDRCGKDNGTYLVVKDRYIPDSKDDVKGKVWEHINTIGDSWGYKK